MVSWIQFLWTVSFVFEEEFHMFFDAQHPEILETIRETKTCQMKRSWMLRLEFLNQSASNRIELSDGSI